MIRARLWLLLPLLALVEVGAHALIRVRVPEASDWRDAAAFVRAEHAPGDALAVVPDWADPILREHLGDRISLAMAGRSDLSAYARLWTLSIRGHQPGPGPGATLELTRAFGAVTVYRHRLPKPSMKYDLVEHLFEASVSRGDRPCVERRGAPARGGGLGKGAIAPARRFECKRGSARGFVAPVVLEDLDLRPRHCVFQPALPGGPMRVTFPRVPLADELVFHAGLYYEDERMREGAPVRMRVLIDGEPRAELVHRDGDGWVRLAVPTADLGDAEVTVEVASKRPKKRGFCWSGSVREHLP